MTVLDGIVKNYDPSNWKTKEKQPAKTAGLDAVPGVIEELKSLKENMEAINYIAGNTPPLQVAGVASGMGGGQTPIPEKPQISELK